MQPNQNPGHLLNHAMAPIAPIEFAFPAAVEQGVANEARRLAAQNRQRYDGRSPRMSGDRDRQSMRLTPDQARSQIDAGTYEGSDVIDDIVAGKIDEALMSLETDGPLTNAGAYQQRGRDDYTAGIVIPPYDAIEQRDAYLAWTTGWRDAAETLRTGPEIAVMPERSVLPNGPRDRVDESNIDRVDVATTNRVLSAFTRIPSDVRTNDAGDPIPTRSRPMVNNDFPDSPPARDCMDAGWE
jgi:hypothetical protein